MPKAPRETGSLYWLGTFNNYSEDELSVLLAELDEKCKKYVMQEEIGSENGTKHLQMKVAFSKRTRPTENFSTKKIHWEKSCKWKGWQYCAKDATNNGRRWAKGETIPKVLWCPEPYGWQLPVVELAKTEPHKRKIHWFWSAEGSMGKSDLCRYLTIKMGALPLSGKADDMKCCLAEKYADGEIMPELIVIDIPRSQDHVSYGGFEYIKNANFFSGKYKSKPCTFNPPHIFIFANREPDYTQLSADR